MYFSIYSFTLQACPNGRPGYCCNGFSYVFPVFACNKIIFTNDYFFIPIGGWRSLCRLLVISTLEKCEKLERKNISTRFFDVLHYFIVFWKYFKHQHASSECTIFFFLQYINSLYVSFQKCVYWWWVLFYLFFLPRLCYKKKKKKD